MCEGGKLTLPSGSNQNNSVAQIDLGRSTYEQDLDGLTEVGRKPYQIIAPGSGTLRDGFAQLIPTRPYCTNDVKYGLIIRKRIDAVTYRHVQLNGPNDIRWLTFDVDRPDARFAAEDANLPPPTVFIGNPRNGHAHYAYLLGSPVLTFPESRRSPLEFAAAIERGFVRRLGADRHYCGLIAKNPLHPDWCFEWLESKPYDLATLADWLFEGETRQYPRSKDQFGLGRNCQIFDELRVIAYREVLTYKNQRATCAVFEKRLDYVATSINQQFSTPLSFTEVRSISRSVAKWTWRRFSSDTFSAIQSMRARGTRKTTKARMAIVDALNRDCA